MKLLTKKRAASGHKSQAGLTLVELMMSLAVLAIGMAGICVMFVSAMASNQKSSRDTSATLLAQMIAEQIAAQPANSTATFTITDCGGTSYTIATDGGAVVSPAVAGGGNGVALDSTTGNIDWNSTPATTLYSTSSNAGYAIQTYKDCGNSSATGRQALYEVRWHVQTLSAYTRLITVGTKEAPSTGLGGLHFAMPVTLKTIGGV